MIFKRKRKTGIPYPMVFHHGDIVLMPNGTLYQIQQGGPALQLSFKKL